MGGVVEGTLIAHDALFVLVVPFVDAFYYLFLRFGGLDVLLNPTDHLS